MRSCPSSIMQVVLARPKTEVVLPDPAVSVGCAAAAVPEAVLEPNVVLDARIAEAVWRLSTQVLAIEPDPGFALRSVAAELPAPVVPLVGDELLRIDRWHDEVAAPLRWVLLILDDRTEALALAGAGLPDAEDCQAAVSAGAAAPANERPDFPDIGPPVESLLEQHIELKIDGLAQRAR